MGASAPPPPDFTGAAQQTADQGAALNRPDISTPWGSQQWTQGPDGQWQMSTQLGGGLGQAAQGLQQQAGLMGQPMDWSQLGPMQDGSAARQQAIDAAYGQATSRLDPQWQQRQRLMASQLANQGLAPGSQAHDNAMRDFANQRNDAYGSAMSSAIGQGTAAGQAVFAQNMASRQQQLAEMLRQRGMPLQELQALQGFLSMPGYGQVQGPDLLGAAMGQANYDMGRYQADQQMWGDVIGGGASLLGAGAGLLLSDERAKKAIVRYEREVLPGVPLASWEYRHAPGKRHVGVIAQDLERVAPDMVRMGADGLRRVDYSQLRRAIR